MSKGIPDDMQQSIAQFYTHAEGIVNSFAGQLENEPIPDIIYTDGTGLRGILQGGTLWFTDIFNLNDPTELRHGLNPAVELVQEAARTGAPEMRLFADDLVRMLKGGIERIAHYFVCCFSKCGDDLGQWRAYADNGRGFAIGFDGPALEKAFATDRGTPIPGRMTFPVTYEDDQLRQMYRQVISEVAPLVSAPRGRGLADELIAEYMSELSINISVPIVRAALFFKHKAYRNEEEYRFFELHQAGVDSGSQI
jgi:Protein of unknown function (DUF2971)